MATALMVECPECHAPPGSLCVNRPYGAYMVKGHASRSMIAVLPDGDVGAMDEDDPDGSIMPLGDIAPTAPLDSAADNYPDRAVLRWSRTYGDNVYIYTAIKAMGTGWFLSGKTQDAIPWDELWNKYLLPADWVEQADHWGDVIVVHTVREIL